MKLGNIEIDFSFTNTSNLKKLQKAYENILEKDKNKKKGMNYIEQMDFECDTAREFFNEVFGEGFDKKICGEENDYEKIMDLLDQVMQEYNKQQSRVKEKFAKYSPNRVKKGRKW